jgi:hypothetical protein
MQNFHRGAHPLFRGELSKLLAANLPPNSLTVLLDCPDRLVQKSKDEGAVTGE